MDAFVGERRAVGGDVISEDLPVGHAAGFDDVEDALVGREAQPIRPQYAVGDNRRFAGGAVDPVHVSVDFGLG
ncbi:MAG: hypothetical protein E6974_09215, partial [Veillonella sp.]|nr:hypothetical protein [Veillonella sp.]